MQEILRGIYPWAAVHPKIHTALHEFSDGRPVTGFDIGDELPGGILAHELDFEHLLLAHGGPAIGDGRRLLRDLLEAGGRTAFEI